MVEYDSAIPPGRAGKVNQEVNLHGIYGTFRKDVVVVSNAANEPSLRLYLKGTIQAIIDVEPRYIRLPTQQGDTAKMTITLKTEKADLSVGGISFQPSQGPAGQWDAGAMVNIVHSLKRGDEKDSDGRYRYELTMRVDGAGQKSSHGTFVITTNHARKPSLEIRGMLLGQ